MNKIRGEGALERVEQAGHGGFEGTEEFRSRGSGAEVEPWEQTGGGEGVAVGGEAVAEFGSNHSGVFFLLAGCGQDIEQGPDERPERRPGDPAWERGAVGEELPIGGFEVVTAGTRPDGPGWYGNGPLAREMN